jgi:hypothetical protein
VLNAIRRVALGIAVVAAASLILLLSDLQHRERAARAAAAKHKWKIYFIQYNESSTSRMRGAACWTGCASRASRTGAITK